MSRFEKSARNSVAASILNKMRHWLQGREPGGLSDEERAVMEKALQLIATPSFSETVLHSFRGGVGGLSFATLAISNALYAAAQGDTEILRTLERALAVNTASEGNLPHEAMIELLNRAIGATSHLDPISGHGSQHLMVSKGL